MEVYRLSLSLMKKIHHRSLLVAATVLYNTRTVKQTMKLKNSLFEKKHMWTEM